MISFPIKVFESFKNKLNMSSFGFKSFKSYNNNKLIQICYLIGSRIKTKLIEWEVIG